MATDPGFPPRISVDFYARGVAFNADASRLYVVDEGIVLGFPRDGQPPIAFEEPEGHRPDALAVSPTGLAVVCTNNTVISIYDADGKLQRSTPLTEGVETAHGLAFSPDGDLFAVGTGHMNSPRTTLEIFSAAGERLRVIDDEEGFGIPNVCFTADGRHVVTLRSDRFEHWPVEGGQPERQFVRDMPFEKTVSAASGLFVIGWRGLMAFDERGKVLWRQPSERELDCVAVSPDASSIVAGMGRTLTVYTRNGEIAKTIKRKSTNEVRSLAISADGLLAVGTDGGVEMLRLADAPTAPAPVPRTAAPDASVAESWRRIDGWLTRARHDAPNPGASRTAISDLANQLGIPMPPDLIESLAIHDGADDVIGGWDLLDIRGIASKAKLMKKLTDDGTFAKAEAEADPHPRIKSIWWNVQWIPIVSSGSGHLFCVDMDPAPGGKAGQVILFFHDDSTRLCIADSIRAWLAAIAADLEAGTYEYDAGSQTWSDSAFLQSSLEGQETYG
jgi:cell wall assembly regulator SMI1